MSDRENDGTAITHGLTVRTCSVCGRPMWQKHMETCTGPPKLVCGCPFGWRHLPGCVEVTGDDPA